MIPAIAPTIIISPPRINPLSAITKGRESTPEPIAAALSWNVLPLRDPFSSGPKVLFKNDR